jgi:hypothetical protein
MKKLFIGVAIISLILVTGCQSSGLIGGTTTKSCTLNEVDEDGYEQNTLIEMQYGNDNIIDTFKYKIEMKIDPEYLELSYENINASFEAFNEIDGYEAEVLQSDDSVTMTMYYDFTKIDIEEYQKVEAEVYGTEEDSMFMDNEISNIDVDEYVTSELSDYTCK